MRCSLLLVVVRRLLCVAVCGCSCGVVVCCAFDVDCCLCLLCVVSCCSFVVVVDCWLTIAVRYVLRVVCSLSFVACWLDCDGCVMCVCRMLWFARCVLFFV